ncbi:hypothetical protein I8748_00565 [Nostoc sp. CENA67]|uniref:Uncharacterized protein n=1 Tax=Amazonocrinis nigriterrae CENA67 TaxID=2794033 RepID=A0A8J7HQJ3_9NOST|nr:NB-ARC domain-containing protein [Amazonocrinis nigriterrae]MBH8560714.1 hypothetical protein [Amazonocrinis nigriterrae CENA67]
MNLEELLRFVDQVVFAKTQKHLKDVQILILQGALQGQNYEKIAEAHGYSNRYLKQDVGPSLWKLLSQVFEEKVTKTNFQAATERQLYLLEPSIAETVRSNFPEPQAPAIQELQTPVKYQDWGDVVDVSTFYGRNDELTNLHQCILSGNCRLLAFLGMGGVGKTTLSIKLAQQIQDDFTYVIWRSLQNAPPVEEILIQVVEFLSQKQEITLPDSLEDKVSRLLHYLRASRCLIILDNLESILEGGTSAGQYKERYKGYGYLLKQIGEVNHQSCLILTSREKPKEIALLEGPNLKVRSLLLSGLTPVEGRKILNAKGCFAANDNELQEICTHYAGNPLALKIAAAAVKEVCAGDIGQLIPLLRQGKLQFEDIQDLLEQQFNRLSPLEQQLMYWLAVNREPVSLPQLAADFVFETVTGELVKGVQSLARRALIEQKEKQLVLQPVVLEYVTQRIIVGVCDDITNSQQKFLNDYALIKAESKDYIREAQIRFILQPIVDKLASELGSYIDIKNKLISILTQIKQELPFRQGYIAGNLLHLFIHLKIDLSGYDFSDLTIRQAYLQGIELHDVNFSNCNFQKTLFTKVFGAVISVRFSPDGQVLATSNTNCSTKLWQVDTGQNILNLNRHDSWIYNIDFSPNNQIILSASEDKTIKLWDLKNGNCIRTIDAHKNILRTATFHPSGNLIASCGDDGLIKFWNVDNGECLQVLEGHEGWVISVSFSPDGKLLASSSNDKSIRIWEVETGRCIRVLKGHQDWVMSVSFSPDGQMIASSSFDSSIRLWKVSNGDCIHILQGHTFWVWTAAFSPDGKQIASAGSDKTIKVWDITDGRCLKTITGHTNQIWSLTYHPDGQQIATGSDDQTVRIWDITDGKCLKIIQGYTNWVKSAKFTPNGKQLVSAHQDHTVRVWDIFSHQNLHTLKGHESPVLSVALHPDGQLIASGSEDGTIKIWDINNSNCLYTLSEHAGDVWGITFSPNGQLLVSGSYDKTIKIWQLNEQVCIHTLKGYDDRIGAATFNPEGSLLATAGESTVDIWDVASGICLYSLEEEGHKGRVKSVAFSPDGQLLVSVSTDKTIKIWDLRKRQCIRNLTGHDASVLSVAFSPDGQKIVTSACERTIRIWNVHDGKCIQELAGHQNWVWSVIFSPDGQLVASASQDESIILWDVNTGENFAVLRTKRPYEGMQISGATGLTVAEKSDLMTLGAI